MRRFRRDALNAALVAFCAAAPAAAEPLVRAEVLFQAPRIASGTVPTASFTLSAAPLPPTFETVKRAKPPMSPTDVVDTPAPHSPPASALALAPPTPTRSTTTPSAAPAAAAPAPVPEPPSPPARVAAAPPQRPSSAPAATPTAMPLSIAARPAPKIEMLGEGEIIQRANRFFTNLGTLTADFTQIGGDGRRLTGTLYLQRPGKLRFEYDRPATLEVIADGSSVAVRDRKLSTQDIYPISQTPLKFLLRERVNLGQDIRVTGVSNDGDAVRIQLEDRSTLGGTSKIILFFDPKVETLTQWRITDPQGFQTTLMLNNVERIAQLDQQLFIINYHTKPGRDSDSDSTR
jgi:outer membrane lipoprotein-sorting protein